MACGRAEDFRDLRVLKGADDAGSEPERSRLKKNILTDMAGFDVSVSYPSPTVLPRYPVIFGSDNEHDGRLRHPSLPERSARHIASSVTLCRVLERMLARDIMINAALEPFDALLSHHRINIQRVERARGWR